MQKTHSFSFNNICGAGFDRLYFGMDKFTKNEKAKLANNSEADYKKRFIKCTKDD